MADNNLVGLTTELTVAWIANPNTRVTTDDIQPFMASVHSALGALSSPAPTTEPAQEYVPAVTARRSLASPDKIVSMIDGKPYTSLTRHLKRHGLTPAQYRERYGLKPDYPMVAPAFSEARRATAKALGLGRKAGEKVIKGTEKKVARGISAAKRAAKAHLGSAID